MNFKLRITQIFIFSLLAFAMASCSKNDTTTAMGTVSFEATDSPSDDANVQGVFVTVVAIKVDGKAISNFSGKTTFDLAAYQRGEVKSLGNTSLQAGTYSNITLVLDNATDQNGSAPGCYILTKASEKKAIAAAATTTEINLTGSFKAVADQSTTAVMDFDLRKTVVYDGTSGYKFASSGELTSGVRVVQKSETGIIKGTTTNNSTASSDKIVVYAYKKGAYNKTTEMSGQGTVEFKNSVVSSAVVSNTYALHFLEAGDYELHFVSYKDKNSDGKLDIQGEFQASILGGLNITALNVTANATVAANISLGAILPL